jgi:hypothetical protein
MARLSSELPKTLGEAIIRQLRFPSRAEHHNDVDRNTYHYHHRLAMRH